MTTATEWGRWSSLGPSRFDLGEGGRWDGAAFWQADVLEGTLWRTDADLSELGMVWSTDRPVGCMVPTTAGLVVLVGRGVAAVNTSGSVTMLCEPVPEGHRINDSGVVNGRLYFGSMAPDGEAGCGSLWRMDYDGTVTQILDGLGCPNGPAFSVDGTIMYLADSTAGVIYRHSVRADGTLGDAETFATFSAGEGIPDGMCVDQDDRLWVAVWDGAAIRRYRRDGALDEEIPVPVARPSSVTIVPGAVLVTSARYGLAAPGRLDGATLVHRSSTRPAAVRRMPIAVG